MSQNRVPTLWLRCGTCGGAPKLATLSAAGAPRITGAVVLPEENVILLPRRPAGRCKAFPRKGSPREFTHLVECICGARYKVSAQRLAGWWAEFAATGRQRDTRYLGRDL